MLKRILKSPAATRIAAVEIGGYLGLVDATSSRTIVGRALFDAAYAQGRGVIFAFWHGRLMLAPFIRREAPAPVHMLVSRHRDGEIIANAAKRFDVTFIRGSAANPEKPGKQKDGASAVAQTVAALRNGGIVGVTPDGPRGPAEVAKAGVIRLAQLSGAPILPVGMSASRARRMNSWDGFLLAAPFSKIAYAAAEPIAVAPDLDGAETEALRARLTDAIATATAEADELAGRAPAAGSAS